MEHTIFRDRAGNKLKVSSNKVYGVNARNKVLKKSDTLKLFNEYRGEKRQIDLGQPINFGVVVDTGKKIDTGKKLDLGKALDFGRDLDL